MDISRTNSLLCWLRSFPHLREAKKLEMMLDGRVLALTLHQIDSTYFTEDWLNQILQVSEGNSQLKQRNMRKVMKSLVEYSHEVLQISNKRVENLKVVDLMEGSNQLDLIYLIQSVLNVAVNCEKKEEHVSRIMQLDERVQKDIMEMLQEFMEQNESRLLSHDHANSQTGDVRLLTEERDRLLQESSQRDEAIKSLGEEKYTLHAECERLRESVSSLEEKAHRCVELELQVEHLLGELSSQLSKKVELEALVEDSRTKNDILESELVLWQEKNMMFQSRQVEMEMMRDKLDELPQLELKLSNYAKKISRLESDARNVLSLKEKMSFLQEKNQKLIEEKLKMESGLREMEEKRFQSLQQDEKLVLLHSEFTDCKNNLMQSQRSQTAAEESNAALKSELRKLTEERDSLLVALNSVPDESSDFTSLDPSFQLGGDRLDSITEVFTPEMKERVARLESDNLELKNRMEASVLVSRGTDSSARTEEKEGKEDSISPGVSNIEVFEKELLIDKLKSELKSRDSEISKLKNYLVKLKKKVQLNKGGVTEEEWAFPRMEHEDKLMTASWYNMGLELHRKFSKDIYSTPLTKSEGASFIQSLMQRRKNEYDKKMNLKYVSTPTKETLPELTPESDEQS